MTLNELAKAYGVTRSAVNKWSAEKRAAAKLDIEAGVLPHVADLIAELSRECYLASMYFVPVTFESFFSKTMPMFSVYYRKPADVELTYIAGGVTPLNAYELTGAIEKVKELRK